MSLRCLINTDSAFLYQNVALLPQNIKLCTVHLLAALYDNDSFSYLCVTLDTKINLTTKM